jgi:Flp pilus assembly protein TadD
MQLVLLNGSGAPAEIALPRNRSTMITHGTFDGAADDGIRAMHAWIHNREGAVSLQTGRSPRGTFLNGERISGRHALRAGDVIGFGDREYRAVTTEAGGAVPTKPRGSASESAPRPEAPPSPVPDDALAASQAAYRRGDHERALRILVAELDRRPDNGAAWLARGILEWETGRVDSAARTLHGYLQAEPHSFKALAYYGLVLKHQRRFGEAADVLQLAHRLAPSRDLEQEIAACQDAARRVVPRPPRSPKWHGSLIGVARDVSLDANLRRSELRFTLTMPSAPDRKIPVLMKCGRVVGGMVGNGHWVELPPGARPYGGGYKVKRLRDLSTGQELSGGPSPVVNAGLRGQFGMPRGFRF